MKTPAGKLIEGEGVIPDEMIRRTREDVAAGRDPVLAAARQWLNEQRAVLPAIAPPLTAPAKSAP